MISTPQSYTPSPPGGETANHSRGDYGPQRRWAASLELGFAQRNGRTALRDMSFEGPLRVQRPFYPEGDICHCYLLHPPGGLVSGDQLHISAACDQGAHAALTTPSAGKIYGADSNNVQQGQDVRLRVDNAALEWLPMETIIFDRANAMMRTTIELTGQARIAGWEILCLGRPEGEHPFEQGVIEQSLDIRRDGKPLLLERQRIEAGGDVQRSRFGLGGATVCGTFYATGFPAESDQSVLLERVRDINHEANQGIFAATFRRDVLIMRYLGEGAEEARRLFERAWAALRPMLFGREACPPRIWAT